MFFVHSLDLINPQFEASDCDTKREKRTVQTAREDTLTECRFFSVMANQSAAVNRWVDDGSIPHQAAVMNV